MRMFESGLFASDRTADSISLTPESTVVRYIEQEFLLKDPSRKLKIPKNLRPKDKQVLTWRQIWEALEHLGRRDRLILTLDLTEALRPSELFALRWQSFDNWEPLTITETVYKGKIRLYGKIDGSLTDVHLPPELAEELLLWKDIQAHLRHAKADTTANEYMQELPESVKTMVGSVYTMIKKGENSKQCLGDLLPNRLKHLL